MPNVDNNEKSRSDIEQQAINAIDDGATIIELIADLEFHISSEGCESYREWTAYTPFEAMLRALYLKDLMAYSRIRWVLC